jgi:hypothetical protein
MPCHNGLAINPGWAGYQGQKPEANEGNKAVQVVSIMASNAPALI